MQDLRPYQSQAVQYADGHRSKRILLVSPTGSGKTRILIELARRHNGRVLMLCPWRQLVFQATAYLNSQGVTAEVELGLRKSKNAKVVVTTVQTAARRKLGDFGLIFVDEAHRAVAPQCLAILKKYPRSRIIGLTATPCRLDRKPLGDVFDDLKIVVDVETLIKQGYLVTPTVYGPQTPLDTSRIAYDKKTGDYSSRSAGAYMSRPKLIGNAVEHWKRIAKGRKTFVYCCHLAHARHVLEEFQKSGVAAEILDGSMCQTKRQELLDRLEAGDLTMLVNVGVLTESIDCPPLACQVLLRPTLSTSLHLQIIGRGLRPSPQTGKSDCIYLDHADNFRKHGFPQDRREWDLNPKQKKPSRQEIENATPRARPCPACKRMIPFSSKICPHCGFASLPAVLPGQLAKREKHKPVIIRVS